MDTSCGGGRPLTIGRCQCCSRRTRNSSTGGEEETPSSLNQIAPRLAHRQPEKILSGLMLLRQYIDEPSEMRIPDKSFESLDAIFREAQFAPGPCHLNLLLVHKEPASNRVLREKPYLV
ncbi:unnamed protein product [Gongylonema pulchrum]|uniref:Uncharacterized protein n=1 Tax=Gongylonema pulchrum TaxID=637853 RepID=A0A183EFI0_9BILA|nr:unnamed protein product [Gongylonema pulchrum]